MAKLQEAFDATTVSPDQGVGQLPVGKHIVTIIESDMKPTKNGDGYYLQLDLEIVEGPLAGATGAYRLNLYNSSEKAVAIAQRQLSAICHAIQVFQIEDSEELHGFPFMVEVAQQKDDEKYTEVKRVFPIEEATEEEVEEELEEQKPAPKAKTAPKKAPASKPTPAKSSGGIPPWVK